MSILIARDIELAFGNRRILRGCDLKVSKGAKVGLVGANGSGKSTLLRVLAGEFRPDHGSVQLSGRLGFLDQNPELSGATVGDCAREAVAWHGELLAEYGRALEALDLTRSAALQDQIDVVGWEVDHRVDAMLDRLGAPPREAAVQRLSGGERRRLALALALLGQPELLMLDEPTNHLDADAVEWLQAWLQGYRGALLLVTHDRYLLEAVAETIVEIEAGATVSYPGSYADYLVARAERQVALRKAETRRLSMIAREAVWASRSPAARSTKQKARLQRLDALRDQEGLALDRGFELDLRTGVRQGSVLVQLTGVRKAYGGRELLGGLDLSLAPGERLGVLGPNGAGKSTLLRILAGTLSPDAGQVSRASRVKVAVLNQERTGLEAPDGSDWTVFEAAGGGNDYVFVAGRQGATWQRGAGGRDEGAVHVASFLGRFMFPREALEQRVSALSGGERARLLLARLLLEGASVLLLDEPTNDLDLLTLRVLEEALLAYDGSAIIVTHDRAFLDRVCTGVIAFEPDQEPPVVRYGSRLQHVRTINERRRLNREQDHQRQRPTPQRAPGPRPKKLSYREKQEFEALPAKIEAAEAEQEALAERLADPQTYRSGQDVAALQARTAALPTEIEALYERWAELEERAG